MGVEGACVHKNFEQYGLSHGLVDLVACDMSNPPLRLIPSLFDAIICDRTYFIFSLSLSLLCVLIILLQLRMECEREQRKWGRKKNPLKRLRG